LIRRKKEENLKGKPSHLQEILGVFIFLVSCNFIACGDFTNNLGLGNNPTGVVPVKTISIKLEEKNKDELIAQLKAFAQRCNLEFSVTYYTNQETNDTFLVFMNGQDFHISAFKSSYAEKLDINFFPNNPNDPPSQETIEELYNNLKTFLSEIPSVVILEDR
jgi:hypothetical protein